MQFKMPEMTAKNLLNSLMVLIVLLMVSFTSLIYSSFINAINQQGSELVGFTDSLQNRIDRYRYLSWQIFDSFNYNADSDFQHSPATNENELQTGVYSLPDKSSQIETLIFGEHNQHTHQLANNLSSFIGTLWGSKKQQWTLYYLNGEDNSLAVISTSHSQALLSRYEGRNITAHITMRRKEMLQQANTLDERESFSNLRFVSLMGNGPYLTMRTTFNQPGRLASILAFDLPLLDLNRNSLMLDHIQIHNEENFIRPQHQATYSLDLTEFSLKISSPLSNSPLSVSYHLPITKLLTTVMTGSWFVSVLILILMMLTAASILVIRRGRKKLSTKVDPWVEKLQKFTQESVHNLPIGYLIYDAQQSKILLTNEYSEQLTPHLNIQKMLDMSANPFELLQVTVNNEIYEVRRYTSQVIDHYHIFMFREQNREQIVNKQLQKAQQVLERNHKLRRQLFAQISDTFAAPIQTFTQGLKQLAVPADDPGLHLINRAHNQLSRLTEHLHLLNQIESGSLKPAQDEFNLQNLLDDIIARAVPTLVEKDIELLVDNSALSQSVRIGDAQLLSKAIETLLIYSVENTLWGKIKVKITESTEYADRLLLEIVDTGVGLSSEEQHNINFPFTSPVSAKYPEKSNSLDLYFCRSLLSKLNASLEISSKPRIGSRYQLSLVAKGRTAEQDTDELLLDDVRILVDVVAEDTRTILCKQINRWGAKYYLPEDRYSGQLYDLQITDNQQHLVEWGVLLTSEAVPTTLGSRQRQANHNISRSLFEALMSLLEQQIAEDVLTQDEEEVATTLWDNPKYFAIFSQTVSEDIDKLYTELSRRDYRALALTAHRVKGVFAMLNLPEGKRICEQIEDQIELSQDINIKISISELADYTRALLHQGNRENE